MRFQADQFNKEYNAVDKKIAQKKKESKGQDPCTEEIAEAKKIDENRSKASKIEKDFFAQLLEKVYQVGNIVHESVPFDNNEDNNKVERTWGEIKNIKIDSTYGRCHHHEILAMIDGYDPKRGN